MRVAVYACVSTQRQAQAQTIQQQLERLRGHCDAQGWTLRDQDIFRDDGYSGGSLHRPGLDRLREKVAAGEVDRVLVTAPERLARNFVHQALLLEEIEQIGCVVEFLDRPMSHDPHDQLLLQIRGAVAEYERSVIAERMRRGRQRKLEAGLLLPWTRAPYGYRLDPEHPRDPAGVRVEPAEAAIVQEVFAIYLEDGGSLLGLAKLLGQRQIPTPNGQTHWSSATVRGIVTNPSYTGQVYAGRSQARPARIRRSATHPIGRPSTTQAPLPLETWIPVATIPALISREQFDRVQAKLARNQQFARRHNTAHDYLLRALVSCGVCQMACAGRTVHSRRHDYYVCRGKGPPEASHRSERCPARYIPAQQLDELVWQDLFAGCINTASIAEALERARGGQWCPQELQARREVLRKGGVALEQQRDRLTEAYLGGVMPLPEYQRRRGELDQKFQGLEQKSDQLAAQAGQQIDVAAHVRGATDFCQRVQAGLAGTTFVQRRQLVELLIDRVVVIDGEVEIRYVIPISPRGEHVRFCHLRLDYFDPPMAPRRLPKYLGGELCTEQVVSALAAALLADASLRFDHADGLQPRPVMPVLQPRQDVRIADHPAPTHFDPSVPLVHALLLVDDHVITDLGLGIRERLDDIVVKGLLILFERQDVVGILLDDLLGNLPLAAHRIDRDDAAGDCQSVQEFGNRSDLIRLVVDLDLGQNEAIGARPSRDHMDGGFAVGPIVGATHRLTVDGDDLGGEDLGCRLHPSNEARLELLGVESGEDPIEGVVGGNPVGQVEKALQPRFLRLPEQRDLVPAFRPTNHRTQGDDENRHQRMEFGSLDPRIFQRGKVLNQRQASNRGF